MTASRSVEHHADDPAPDELSGVLDHLGLGLIRFDANLRVRSANGAAHRVLDRRPGSLVGRSVMETFVDHRLEVMVQDAARGGDSVRELESSSPHRVVVRTHPEGRGGVWVTLEDVTELEHLRRIRREFVDNVSHELRTPLANIRLLTELLTDDLAGADVPERIRERVATIDVESGHLVQMVNELLDLARIEQTTTQVRRDAVELAPLVGASVERLRTFAQRQGVDVVAKVSVDIPAVQGDEERLDQLLMNLLHNAIKFSPDGGTVTITADEHPDAVVVSVRDEGIGIPEADQPRVFERFYKVDRARARGHGGTGLGLAIARHIVEAHDGQLWLESSEGVGSTFSFSLPIA